MLSCCFTIASGFIAERSITSMPLVRRTRAAAAAAPDSPSMQALEPEFRKRIEDAGFVVVEVKEDGSWAARCLTCTSPEDYKKLGNMASCRQMALCRSVRSCRIHQRKQHADKAVDPEEGVQAHPQEGVEPEPEVGMQADPQEGVQADGEEGLQADPEEAVQADLEEAIPLPPPASPEAPVIDSDSGPDTAYVAPDVSFADPVSSSDVGSDSSDNFADDEVHADLAPGPRKGSGDWWFKRRLEPVATGSSMSALQAAFNISEFRATGVTKSATTCVAMLMRNLLCSIPGPHNGQQHVHVPSSTHLVEKILGVRNAKKFEFGWCPTCGHRYRALRGSGDMTEVQADLLSKTCPQCGSATYKVRSSLSRHNGSSVSQSRCRPILSLP